MTRTACTVPIMIALLGCGGPEPAPVMPDPASAGAAENYPHARALLVGIKVPNATALQAKEVSEAGDLIKVTFEGGHHVWLDRKSGMPNRYLLAGTDTRLALLPLHAGPLAAQEFGHDPLAQALQDLLDVELASPGNIGGSTDYPYLVEGMPVFEMPGLMVFAGDQGVITELKNMTTVEVDEAELKISLQKARDIVVSFLITFHGEPLTYKVHDLQLGYVRTSKSPMPVTVRRAWHVPIEMEGADFDFFIDAEFGHLVDGYLANNSGRKPIAVEGNAVQDMVIVGAVDPDRAGHVIKLLRRHGIDAIVEGSVAYGVRVPKAKAQLTVQLLGEDSKREGYWFKEE